MEEQTKYKIGDKVTVKGGRNGIGHICGVSKETRQYLIQFQSTSGWYMEEEINPAPHKEGK